MARTPEGEPNERVQAESERVTSGRSARELVADLPQDSLVARALSQLVTRQFCAEYASLSDKHRNTVSLALLHIRRELLARENADFGRRPEDLFRAYRTGSQLDLSRIERLRLSPHARLLLRHYEDNIREHGTNALAHACVSGRVFGSLRRAGVETIDAAEHLLRTKGKIPYLNEKGIVELVSALAEWRQLTEKPHGESGVEERTDSVEPTA